MCVSLRSTLDAADSGRHVVVDARGRWWMSVCGQGDEGVFKLRCNVRVALRRVCCEPGAFFACAVSPAEAFSRTILG